MCVELIRDKVNELINMLMNKGVQIEELCENIWSENYKSINIVKGNKEIEFTIVYFDEDEKNDILMKYIYNEEKYLKEILEIVDGISQIVWNRDFYIKTKIENICELIKLNYSLEEAEVFIDTLPDELKKKFIECINEIA